MLLLPLPVPQESALEASRLSSGSHRGMPKTQHNTRHAVVSGLGELALLEPVHAEE